MNTRHLIVSIILALLVAAQALSKSANSARVINEVSYFDPSPDNGFYWPYLMYHPQYSVDDTVTHRLLVMPNNTGSGNDTFKVHLRAAVKLERNFRWLADTLGSPLLVPVFPRPYEQWQLYTQALDRDVMTTDIDSLARLDLQLIAMMDDAIRRLKAHGRPVAEQVMMFGFSASGQFVDRFTVLHPERVRAAAIGSPGGWPIAPLAEWADSLLRYPVGVGDLDSLTGREFNFKAYQRVALFHFLGDQDTNDAVVFEDAFDKQDKDLIFALFGSTPVDRWPSVLAVHDTVGCQCTFRLYKGVGHTLTPEMLADITDFFLRSR